MRQTIRGVATADLHLGIDNVGGLDENGNPRRLKDFLDNFGRAVDHAIEIQAHLFIIAGDIFKQRNPPQRTLYLFLDQIARLIDEGIVVAVDKGNHEGDSDPFRANVLDTIGLLDPNSDHSDGKVVIFNHPQRAEVALRDGQVVDLIGIPWPRVRNLLPAMGDMPYDQVCAAADAALRARIADLTRQAGGQHPQVLIAHLAIAGADKGSERWMTLGWEPTIAPQDIPPEVAVAIVGHYHHGCQLPGHPAAFYCGSIARIDFGEEDQDKMFWTFEIAGDGSATVEPHIIPDRRFLTIESTVPADLPAAESTAYVISENIAPAAALLDGAVVRVKVTFATAEQAATFNEETVLAAIRERGAWWVAGLLREAPDAGRRWANVEEIESVDPAQALLLYLSGKEPDETRWRRVWAAGVDIIHAAE